MQGVGPIAGVVIVAVLAILASMTVSGPDFSPEVPPPLKVAEHVGPLAPNNLLRKIKRLGKNLTGPETITFSPSGDIIGFMLDGSVSKIHADRQEELVYVGGNTYWKFSG